MNKCAVIPTGDELVAGIIVDTDGPAIARLVGEFFPQCRTTVLEPVPDDGPAIARAIIDCAKENHRLVIVTGGSGGGRRFEPTLAEDCTHVALASVLEDVAEHSLHGSNGHLWTRIVAGRLGAMGVVNVPGPEVEAVAAARAIIQTIADVGDFDPKIVAARATEAVHAEYPPGGVLQMIGFSTFTHEIILPDGVSLLCVGIVSAGATSSPESGVRCLESLRIGGIRDVVSVDTAVSTALAQQAPDWLLAAGVSVCVPGAPGPTGGVIGSPHQEATSAGGASFLPTGGLGVFARPGGPGVVVAGPPELAESLLDGVCPGTHGAGFLDEMERALVRLGVSVALVVCDGTGPGRKPCALAFEHPNRRQDASSPLPRILASH